jgi:hypothetical protein
MPSSPGPSASHSASKCQVAILFQKLVFHKLWVMFLLVYHSMYPYERIVIHVHNRPGFQPQYLSKRSAKSFIQQTLSPAPTPTGSFSPTGTLSDKPASQLRLSWGQGASPIVEPRPVYVLIKRLHSTKVTSSRRISSQLARSSSHSCWAIDVTRQTAPWFEMSCLCQSLLGYSSRTSLKFFLVPRIKRRLWEWRFKVYPFKSGWSSTKLS